MPQDEAESRVAGHCVESEWTAGAAAPSTRMLPGGFARGPPPGWGRARSIREVLLAGLRADAARMLPGEVDPGADLREASCAYQRYQEGNRLPSSRPPSSSNRFLPESRLIAWSRELAGEPSDGWFGQLRSREPQTSAREDLRGGQGASPTGGGRRAGGLERRSSFGFDEPD